MSFFDRQGGPLRGLLRRGVGLRDAFPGRAGVSASLRRGVGRRRGGRGFLLLEVMLAVVIFALGMLALGRCVRETLRAESFRQEDERASRVLANALAQVESGALKPGASFREALKGSYEGMELRVSREPLKEKNEKNQDLTGVYRVKLEVTWEKGGERLSRELIFYHAQKS